MKRSEAIRIIYDTINANLKYDNVSTSREILNELEKAGLLPPLNDKAMYKGSIKDVLSGSLEPLYSWEPEDD